MMVVVTNIGGDAMRSRHIRSIIATAIGTAIAANMPAVASTPAQLTITFLRDGYSEEACLEYSWSDGVRRVISLQQLQQSDSRTDRPPSSPVSQVQVYRLTTDKLTMDIPVGWVFPVPTLAPPVVGATIEVFELRKLVLGTLYYDDGSRVSALHDMIDVKNPSLPPLPCKPQ
jgi:hypothetical protein